MQALLQQVRVVRLLALLALQLGQQQVWRVLLQQRVWLVLLRVWAWCCSPQ